MGRHKYIRWIHERDAAELYDLADDPLEERNVVALPEMRPVVEKAQAELARLTLEALGL
jgi:hypothetical protein